MKDYKIDAFDVEELQKWFDVSQSEKSILFWELENIIFQIISSGISTFYIYENFYDKEWFILLINEKKKYIDTFWKLYSAEELVDEKWMCEQWREYEDEEGNILVEKFEFPDYKEINIEVEEQTGVSLNTGKVETDTFIYFSDSDLEILSSSKVEKIYNFIRELWVEIIGYSGVIAPQKQVLLASGALNEYGFICTIPNNEEFIQHCIVLLEEKVRKGEKRYAVERLEELLMEKILKLDGKYWTQWKNIYVKNDNKSKLFDTLLILLYLKWKIDVEKFHSWKEEYTIDILEYWKDIGIYFDSKNGDVFVDGEKIGSLPINNREYKMFKFLYENIWEYMAHKEVKEAIIWGDRISGTVWNYLSGIKKNLPNKIKDLIHSPSGGYMIKKI